jgi:uncharacterized protein
MEQVLGHVIAVDGSRLIASLESDRGVRLGAMVKVRGSGHDIVGTIGAVRPDAATSTQQVFVVDLIGELTAPNGKPSRFTRGVSHYPLFGTPVQAAGDTEVGAVYSPPAPPYIRIGRLDNDDTQPALLAVNELLAKHFAIVGTTGSGKSCAVTLILSAILADCPNAHIVLLDPHNEYATAFGDSADVLTVENIDLPFWLFNLEEAVRLLVRGGTQQEQEAQEIILKDAIARSRRYYADNAPGSLSITVDTPVPFRVHDLQRILHEGAGRLNKADSAAPYLRLLARLESLRDDRRFAFMFGESFERRDTLSEVVGRLLRIPVSGKPITVIDLSGVPSEIADVIVSLSCRVMFDFTLWSERERRPPILLVCEEAHRFVARDERVGFRAAANSLTRIAKEGRKYGLSLALISQRPSELSPHALSQCGTVFALRMGNELDQRFIQSALPEGAHALINVLPSLSVQHAVVFGEGVSLPMRVRFDDLPPERRPQSENAQFSEAWQHDFADDAFREEGIRKWRLR